MCDFCEGLSYKELKIPIRTSLPDDNVCEIGSPDKYNIGFSCDGCKGCSDENNHFSVTVHEDTLSIGYYHKIRKLTIAPISSRFNINYCPMCGNRISENDHELKFW